MRPEGYLSENSRPHMCSKSHRPCGLSSRSVVLAPSPNSGRAEGGVFGAGAGPAGAGSQEKLVDESLSSHPARQLKGNITPPPQPKWHVVQELLFHGV